MMMIADSALLHFVTLCVERCPARSVSVSLSQIHEGLSAIHKQHGKAVVDLTTIRKLLDILRLDAATMVSQIPDSEGKAGGPFYVVNMSNIIAWMQKKLMQSVLNERYGQASARIVELLRRKRYLEQQKISDLAILPARDARERLYRLYK